MSGVCVACGEGQVAPIAVEGRVMPFRQMPDLRVPADVAIPTCDHCGEEFFDAALAREVDERMEDVYQQALAAKAEVAIRELKGTIPQRDLEKLVGLSAGYLSKLKGGKGASAPLVTLLMLLSRTRGLVSDLRRLWTEAPATPERSVQVETHDTRVMPFSRVPRMSKRLHVVGPEQVIAPVESLPRDAA